MFEGMNVFDALDQLGISCGKDVLQSVVNLLVVVAAAWKSVKVSLSCCRWAARKNREEAGCCDTLGPCLPPQGDCYQSTGPVAREVLALLGEPRPQWERKKMTLVAGALTVWFRATDDEALLANVFLGNSSERNLLHMMSPADVGEVTQLARQVVRDFEERDRELTEALTVEQLKRARLEARVVLPLPASRA